MAKYIDADRLRAEDESLGKTLDEAAYKYAPDLASYIGGSISIAPESRQDLRDAFIAGAKWMSEQGVSWEDKMTYYDGFLLYGKDERAFTMEGNFNEGDKVIVQIRKKED